MRSHNSIMHTLEGPILCLWVEIIKGSWLLVSSKPVPEHYARQTTTIKQ